MKDKTALIGITGNIATGKSVVRRMLMNAGALGLDADVIGHRMIYAQGPAFQDVVDAFGENILNESGDISRARLGQIVFTDPDQLAKLESIIHPHVTKAIQKRLKHSQSSLAALEAIKLLEANLGEICDVVWVSHTSRETQLERLLQTRGLTEDEAWTRINAQPSQKKKLNHADAIIHTDSTFKHTWQQVYDALNDTIQLNSALQTLSEGWIAPSVTHLTSDDLLHFWEAHTSQRFAIFYESIGLGMVQPLTREGRLQALLFWENWNFTGTLTGILPDDFILRNFGIVMEAFQAAAQHQQCEIILITNELVQSFELNPEVLGFKQHKPDDLPYDAWKYAAKKVKSQNEPRIWIRILANPTEA